MGFLDKPRRLWWRKAMFQIHLWGGIVLCLYVCVIGITGSILVFESQLEHAAYPSQWRASSSHGMQDAQPVDLPAAVHTVEATYPGYKLTVAYPPDRPGDNFEIFAHKAGQTRYIFVDANTGQIAGEIDPDHSLLVWIIDLHFRLLAGHTGLIVNGICSACLLLLSITGVVVWWSGLKHWVRGLKVNFRKSWKRINFDLHGAVGFWTLLIVSMWAISGVYFAWPKQIESFVNRFSSVESANPPRVVVPPQDDKPWVPLDVMIQQARRSSPHAEFAGIFFPSSNHAPLVALMARGASRNFSQMDYVYFDPATGRQLALWHRGVNKTWGSKFIFWLGPLHFGYYWGLGIQILWAVLGCALPLLALTGVLMYWNRSLSKKWKSLKA
jgi:uncharacterized iron-regulated membrane protein